jgi:hypothetical protein
MPVPAISNSGIVTMSSCLATVVFVHGLGGSSKGTWTHSETDSFWPMWLVGRKGFENARIATFGYDSGWYDVTAPRNTLNIASFANQLLDALDVHYSDRGDVSPLL